MDPDNPVVKLCSEGMQAEGQGRFDEAKACFSQAWEIAKDDYEACIAAHFLARHQERPEDTLYWNQEALSRAEAVGDDRVRSFYPSLYLNMGHAYELLGNGAEAKWYYDLAAERVAELPDDRYGNIVRGGIAEGHRRISSTEI